MVGPDVAAASGINTSFSAGRGITVELGFAMMVLAIVSPVNKLVAYAAEFKAGSSHRTEDRVPG